jgi:hypothetical protein
VRNYNWPPNLNHMSAAKKATLYMTAKKATLYVTLRRLLLNATIKWLLNQTYAEPTSLIRYNLCHWTDSSKPPIIDQHPPSINKGLIAKKILQLSLSPRNLKIGLGGFYCYLKLRCLLKNCQMRPPLEHQILMALAITFNLVHSKI